MSLFRYLTHCELQERAAVKTSRRQQEKELAEMDRKSYGPRQMRKEDRKASKGQHKTHRKESRARIAHAGFEPDLTNHSYSRR